MTDMMDAAESYKDNETLQLMERRSSTRAFARTGDGQPLPVTDEQRAAVIRAAS